MRAQTKAALFLLFFAPINAELLSASSPPIEFFFPVSFALLTLFYGTGVLIVHELAVRWNKGWPTVMLLGLAYGVVEEALVTMSFFNPTWVDVGSLGQYGRAFDVNWVWSIDLAIFHGVWSISAPILVMRLIFPGSDRRILLSKKAFLAVLMAFPAVSLVLLLSTIDIYGYVAPPIQYLGAMVATILLILAARKAPYRLLAIPDERPTRTSTRMGLAGLGFSIGFFLMMYLVPALSPTPFFPIAMMIALTVAAARYFERNLGNGMNELHKWAMFVGLETMLVIMTFVHELTRSIPNTAGMSLVGVGYIIFFIWLRRRIIRQSIAITPIRAA